MKTAKSIVICLLILCLLCGLSACGKQTVSESDWVWAYNQRGAFSEKGYYFLTPGGFLRFVDTTNGISVCLCSKVDCLHDEEPDSRKSENCEARLIHSSIITPLFFWDNCLYYIVEDDYGPQLYRRDAAGANLEKVTTLGTKYIEQQKDVTLFAYGLSDGYLYYNADVEGSVRGADGGNTVQWETNYIGRLNLETGKEDIIIDNNDAYLTLCAVKKNAALIHTAGIADLAYEDPNYREARLQMPASLQCWDEETGEISTLFEKTVRDFPSVAFVDNGKVYYTAAAESGSVAYAYDLNVGKSDIISEDSLRYIGNGYALRFDQKREEWHLYNLITKKTLSNELSGDALVITTVSDKGFVLKRTAQDDASGRKQVYCYVTFEALSDGLQEGDLMPFYSHGVAEG